MMLHLVPKVRTALDESLNNGFIAEWIDVSEPVSFSASFLCWELGLRTLLIGSNLHAAAEVRYQMAIFVLLVQLRMTWNQLHN